MASYSSLYGGEDRSAGGKVRRERKQPPPKPYDRPIRNNNNGWISGIVGGATRFFPSFFSPSLNCDDGSTEVEKDSADYHANGSLDLLVPKSSVDVGPCEAEGKSELHTNDKDKQGNIRDDGVDPREAKGKSKLHMFDKDRQDTVGDHSNSQQLDVEQLIKGKTFSKEQVDHSMEILRSRVVDTQPEQLPSVSDVKEPDRTEKLLEEQTTLVDKKEELDEFEWTSATPVQTSVQDAAGASPIDIARAHMGSRTAEAGLMPMGSISRSEKFPLPEFSTKSPVASPMPKAPIYWPGAITQDQEYSTPQSQKSRYGFQSFPCTPCSRTAYTKSKSRLNPLRKGTERFPSISSGALPAK